MSKTGKVQNVKYKKILNLNKYKTMFVHLKNISECAFVKPACCSFWFLILNLKDKQTTKEGPLFIIHSGATS